MNLNFRWSIIRQELTLELKEDPEHLRDREDGL
jgi:hypothetical protein